MLDTTKGLNILIIEDQQNEYSLLLDCITNSGIYTASIAQALNMEEAKDYLLGEIPFDLIFIDLMLNACQGADCFLRVIDMADNKLPIIALCEVASPETTLLALINGAKHYLIKGSYDELSVKKVIDDCLVLIGKKANLFESKQIQGEGDSLGAIWDIDLVGQKVKRSGHKFYHLLGYNTEEYYEDYFFWNKSVHPDDKAHVNQVIEASLADNTRRYWEVEYRFRKKDQTYIWVNDRGYILYDAQGKAIRIIGVIVDIDDRKKNESLIVMSDQQQRAFFFHSPYPMWIYDEESKRILEVNWAAIRLYGYSRNEFLQLSIWDIRPENEKKYFLNGSGDNSVDSPIRHWQVKHKKKNGELLFVEVTALNMLFAGKSAVQVMMVDITEKVNVQNERMFVLEVVEKLRREISLVDGLKAILQYVREYIGWQFGEIWLSDFHKETIKLIAYDFDEIENPNCIKLVEEARDKIYPIEKTVFKRKSKHYNPYWIENLQDEELFVRKTIAQNIGLKSGFSVPIPYKGNYVAWVIFFNNKPVKKDVALLNLMDSICKQLGSEIERRNSEEHLNYMFKLSRDLLGMANFKGKFTQVNTAFRKILGYDEDALLHTSIRKLVHPDDWGILTKAFNELKIKPTTPPFELRCIAKDKSIKWLLWTITQLPTEEIIFASGRDITSRKQHEAEREVLINELIESNKDLKQFSYITSHNLRAPLSNLLGILDLINPANIKDEMTLFLFEKFKESSLALNQTINDLLDILVIKNNVNIEQQLIDVEYEVTKGINALAYLQQDVDMTIETDFSAAPQLRFNITYFESILQNLLTNAFKYRSPNRALHLKIYTKDTKDYVQLFFCDNGLGINLERHKDKVFGLYQRFHHLPNSKGLGLYIINSQVRALGGTIEVQSKVEVGTTFIVSFKK